MNYLKEPPRLTPSQENYLEEACRLADAGPIRIGILAQRLKLSLPSVSRGISVLAKKGFVTHKTYGIVELTPKGKEIGNGIISRHSCLNKLFIEVLGMTPEEAEKPIHHLEHGLTQDLLVRLETLISLTLSSEAWCRRLHYRIKCRLEHSDASGARNSLWPEINDEPWEVSNG